MIERNNLGLRQAVLSPIRSPARRCISMQGVYDGWDADMIHGCVCDDGWEGYDCSLRYVQDSGDGGIRYYHAPNPGIPPFIPPSPR